jgi:hypothetical protein
MAASAAGLAIGAGCKNVNENQARQAREVLPAIAKSETPRLWKERWSGPFPKYPADQTIKLIFYGLASVSPRNQSGKTTCEVGFHSSGDVSHRHELSIFTFDNAQTGMCAARYDSTNPREQIAMLAMSVDEPEDKFNEVSFFQPGDVQRRTELTDGRDFRWIIDFESDYFYRNFPGSAHPDKLPKVPHIYKPVLAVPSGLFYTLRKTASTFEIKTTGGPFYRSELGNVADVIGANVYVKPGTGLTLFVNTKPHQVQAPGEIYFINTCTKSAAGDHCDADPSSSDKTRRGDFYLHYKGFELEGKPEYELFLLESHSHSVLPDVVCAPGKLNPYSRLTDESPCAAAGYSGGG